MKFMWNMVKYGKLEVFRTGEVHFINSDFVLHYFKNATGTELTELTKSW